MSTTQDEVFDRQVQVGLRFLDQAEATPDVAGAVARRLATEPRSAYPAISSWLTLAAALLGIAVTTTLIVLPHLAEQPPVEAQDPQGAWRLTYEMPIDELQRLRELPSIERAIEGSVTSLQKRIGELGSVQRLDATTLAVDIDDASAVSVTQVRGLLESKSSYQLRMLAADDYDVDGVSFDVEAEQRRLRAWLDNGGRERILKNARAIDEYQPISKHLRWYPHHVLPSEARKGAWHYRYSFTPNVVMVSSKEDCNEGTVPPHMLALAAADRFLLELVPINMHEEHFRESDFKPSATTIRDGDQGMMVAMQLLRRRQGPFAEWTRRQQQRLSFSLFDGKAVALAKIMATIPGPDFLIQPHPAIARRMAAVLAAPIPVTPKLIASKPRSD